MRCPRCGNQEDKVIDSRSGKEGAVIRRRRECLACSYRFTTYEEIERLDIRVIKRDGRYEPFDRNKLLVGFSKACEKRPISQDVIDRAIDEVMDELEREYGLEIPTSVIGEQIMASLRKIDEVAYIRFASVYKQFRGIDEFIDTVQNLKSS